MPMPTMPIHTVGPAELPLGAIGLGCMGMSDFYGQPDDAESIATLHRAVELGVTLFDTADVYGMGGNEQLVGRGLRDAIESQRDRVILATKFGLVRDDAGQWLGVRGTPDYVRTCCDASLTRLGVDTIDLYYQHRVDPDTPIEDTVGAMAELVAAGKVRAIGLSEASAETIRRAHAVHPVTAVQSEYSLWTRELETDVIPTCAELGIAFVPYSPLGRGMLTGAITSREQLPEGDYRRGTPRFQDEHFDANLAIAQRVRELAQHKGCTPAQLALAWVLAQQRRLNATIVPIPGTKRRRYLEQNIAALDVTLNNDDLASLDDAFPREGVASGDRYPAFRMNELGR